MSEPSEYVALQPFQGSMALREAERYESSTTLRSLDDRSLAGTSEESQENVSNQNPLPRNIQPELQVGKAQKTKHTQQERNRSFRRAVSKYWLVEVMSWLFSLVLFAAIIGLLVGFDGQSIPGWRYGITLGTLISLLSTIATFTIAVPVAAGLGQLKWIWFHQHERPISDYHTLERASNGPFGSFTLILRWRGGLIAVVGAILTILTLAVNPFVQQVLIYESRLVNVTQASIPIALKYDTVGSDTSNFDIDLPMKAAVTNGLLNLDASPTFFDVVPDCSTGNCTWPPYQSLAVCSSCKDLTSELTSTFGDVTDYYNQTYTAYNNSLLNGLSLISPWYLSSQGLFSMTVNVSLNTIAFPETTTNFPLLNYFAIVGPYNLSLNAPYRQSGPYAAECILQFCVNSYTATSRNGTFTETPTAAPKIINSTILHQNAGDLPPYSVFYPSSNNLNMYLSNQFTGYVQAHNSLSGTTQFPTDLTQALFQSLNSTPHTLDSTMANVARSMTLDMRTRPDAGAPVAGHAAAERAFVRIEWPWLALPLALLAAVLAFLVAVGSTTARAGLEPWRDNGLAGLFHGLDVEGARRVRGVVFEEDMEGVAEGLVVRLERGDEGWGLRWIDR